MKKEGIVEKIIFQNEENGYTVASVALDDGDEMIFVGYLHGAEQGMYISAEGEEVDHPTYDLQFKVKSYSVKMPDDIGSMKAYLGSGMIKGVGEALAGRIIKKFKLDTFRIIEEEPERLAEVKGISERKAREIAIQFMEKQEMRDAIIYLGKFGIHANLAVKIYDTYGPKMYDILEKNPYQMAEDITNVGFKTADAIAMRAGIGRDSDFRIRAAILYCLSQAMGLGHMYLPKKMLVSKVMELLSYRDEISTDPYVFAYEQSYQIVPVTADQVENQIVALLFEQKLITKEIDAEEVVYSNPNYYMELNVARMLLELDVSFQAEEEKVMERIYQIEEDEELNLDVSQEEAVKMAVHHGVTIITGGPGTGKTTTINSIISYFEKEGLDILLAAPTGRAAKRICEATGYQAQTIHRLLELTGSALDEGSRVHFERNAGNPLEADVIIVDEMSMVDTSLMHALLSAIIPGTRLILVGDVDQLPSVGAGDVLRDLIDSGAFHVAFLSTIYRQAEGSAIVVNAHKINKGEAFTIDNKSDDFFFMKRDNVKDVLDEVCVLVKDNLPKFVGAKPEEIQVLTPMKKGELGIENLNPLLQQLLNPPAPNKVEREMHGVLFREGDKVMQVKNNYKLAWTVMSEKGNFVMDEGVGVFNGDVGTVLSINEYTEEMTVVFEDDHRIDYPFSMTDELVLSYAITVHKSQGSEYPAVVIPIFSGPRVLMNRNLLYTAVTRAKNCVVLVGSPNMLGSMIQNASISKRYTSLDLRIKELM